MSIVKQHSLKKETTRCLSGTHFRNLTVDDPEIIQKITFHEDLVALENTLCIPTSML